MTESAEKAEAELREAHQRIAASNAIADAQREAADAAYEQAAAAKLERNAAVAQVDRLRADLAAGRARAEKAETDLRAAGEQIRRLRELLRVLAQYERLDDGRCARCLELAERGDPYRTRPQAVPPQCAIHEALALDTPRCAVIAARMSEVVEAAREVDRVWGVGGTSLDRRGAEEAIYRLRSALAALDAAEKGSDRG